MFSFEVALFPCRIILITGGKFGPRKTTRPTTHPVHSPHHEETKYDHHDHDDGDYPPKTISKPYAWKHMGSPSFVLIGRYQCGFEFSAVFSAFWLFLCLFCFLSLCSLTLAHHSPHDRAAVDDITFTWATGFHHFSHFLKVSAMRKGLVLGLLLVVCLLGLHGRSPPF